MQNKLPSEAAAIAATIDPVSQGVGTITSDWVDMSKFDQLMAIVGVGVLGAAATVNAKLEQAQDAAGAGAKDIAGKAITQLVKATDDNKQAVINLRAEELDVNNAFQFSRISVTVAAAASLVTAVGLGFGPRYAPASDSDLASVAEIVN